MQEKLVNKILPMKTGKKSPQRLSRISDISEIFPYHSGIWTENKEI
jgi:hypothetical protein